MTMYLIYPLEGKIWYLLKTTLSIYKHSQELLISLLQSRNAKFLIRKEIANLKPFISIKIIIKLIFIQIP